jgi:chromosome segregation ATPase
MVGFDIVEFLVAATALGALVVSALVARANARVTAMTAQAVKKTGELDGLVATVKALQTENERLNQRFSDTESKLTTFEVILDEREKRIRILEASLRDATQSRGDRVERIKELEGQIKDLQAVVRVLEKGTGK